MSRPRESETLSGTWRGLERIGQRLLDALSHLLLLVDLLGRCLMALRPNAPGAWGYLRRMTLQQLYFSAYQSLFITSLVGAILGMLVALPLFSFGVTDIQLLAQVINVALFHYVVPVLTAVLVSGRSGTAITAEIGELQANGALEALETLAIPAQGLLFPPRVLAMGFGLLLLTFWANLAAVCGAALYFSLSQYLAFSDLVRACMAELELRALLHTALMVFCFGLVIGLNQCAQGLRMRTALDIPRLLPQAFVRSVLSVIMLTLVFALI